MSARARTHCIYGNLPQHEQAIGIWNTQFAGTFKIKFKNIGLLLHVNVLTVLKCLILNIKVPGEHWQGKVNKTYAHTVIYGS